MTGLHIDFIKSKNLNSPVVQQGVKIVHNKKWGFNPYFERYFMKGFYMRQVILMLLIIGVAMWSCTNQIDDNPFFTEYDTPFGVPPFDKIKEEHYMPAYLKGMELQKQEVEVIVNNPDTPTFKNTIEALDNSGALLTKVNKTFNNLNAALTSDNMQQIAKDVAPLLSQHNDDIYLNEKVFQRIKMLYDQIDKLELTVEQKTVLEKYYKDFIRGGAILQGADKEKFREINKELSVLTLKFGENVLKENNAFELVIEKTEDLAGLTESSINAAAEAAKEKGYEGKWLFTLHKPSLIPFLQYSEKRDLREKMFKGYIMRGDNNNELDNKKILSRIAALRVKRANLLGFKSHADFVLDDNMAKKPENVYELLNKLWFPALKRAKNEVKDMQKIIKQEEKNFKLQSWDWWYYAEKLKKAKYDFDEELLRPYFQVDKVLNGVFTVANKLYGIQFVERNDIPKYHPDVKVYEVKEADGSHIAILYVDYYPRASKSGGAWMDAFRKQQYLDGKKISPIIYNVGNFSKPVGDKPALISLEEVETLFHEFGHALHGILSNCTYKYVSGTSVARDFVELPSQIMENWAIEPQVMKLYAKHYQTGEPIPDELIEKIQKTGHFNQGFKTVEYLAASFLDMDWHTLTEAIELDPIEFENKSMQKIGLIPEIVPRYRSPYFSHIFSGEYSSGYYSYIWAEVLDADAFAAFKEKGIFDKETANAFRTNILAAGGSEDPMVLYRRFRGAEPKIEPLLERRGLN
jgi:peptidyl-dipeptidase Dcp